MKRLVLLGGGHAQVQVVKAFVADPPPNTSIVLINRSRLTPYSGMLPGLIAGHYTHAQCHIDLAWLCAQAKAQFIEQEVVGIDTVAQSLLMRDGASLPYDLLSIDTGSTPPLDGVPGAVEHALPVKPIEPFLLHASALVKHCTTPGDHHIAVVGGGAAGFEVLLALEFRIAAKAQAGARVTLHWITDTADILSAFPARVRLSARRLLAARRVVIHTGVRAEQLTADALLLSDSRRIDTQHVVWVTGAQPSAMFAQARIATDARGFIAVDASLRSVSHPNIFASGDCASVQEHPRPKAGVFAVRQGPPLTRNLRLVLAGSAPQPFVPQRSFLVILSAGKRYAIASKGRFAVEGRWVWTWKDWIDRRFMARFQVEG
jgi:selenide,water dikinase